MSGRHAKPYVEPHDRLYADAVREFTEAFGHRPAWAVGRHEKPTDPFYPLDVDWRQPRALELLNPGQPR